MAAKKVLEVDTLVSVLHGTDTSANGSLKKESVRHVMTNGSEPFLPGGMPNETASTVEYKLPTLEKNEKDSTDSLESSSIPTGTAFVAEEKLPALNGSTSDGKEIAHSKMKKVGSLPATENKPSKFDTSTETEEESTYASTISNEQTLPKPDSFPKENDSTIVEQTQNQENALPTEMTPISLDKTSAISSSGEGQASNHQSMLPTEKASTLPESLSKVNNNIEKPAFNHKNITENGTTPALNVIKPPTGLRGPPGRRFPAKPAEPLKVIVIGAGIAGLTAATSLRQAGHDVILFEQSRFSNEVGAAIHVGPNASRLLGKMGYNEKRLRGVHCRGFTMYDSSGKMLMDTLNDHIQKSYQSPWYLTHRIDLHNELKCLALEAEGPGNPAKLNLDSKVVQVDENEGRITLQNGEIHKADLIVAADGIHSGIREMVFDPTKPRTTGIAAYRFVIDSGTVFGNPECLEMNAEDGRCRVILAGEKRVVIYPCRDGTLLNFVCMHPSSLQGETAEGWNSTASVDQVLETYKDFSPLVLNILKKAESVKCWQLLLRDELPSWVKGRVCLVGDAAHPMLPHQGQGGGQAMEDGAALGQLFSFGTKPEKVEEILKLFQQVRHSRASKIQWLSETQSPGKGTVDPSVTQKFIFEHDVTEFAKQTRSSELII